MRCCVEPAHYILADVARTWRDAQETKGSLKRSRTSDRILLEASRRGTADKGYSSVHTLDNEDTANEESPPQSEATPRLRRREGKPPPSVVYL